MRLVEISVDSVESAQAAALGGAQRLELCSALSEGGITPSLGLLRAVRRSTSLPVFVLIRPRGGDFLYTGPEFEVMQEDIRIAAGEGADGVVLGVLTIEGDIDIARTQKLVAMARPLRVTFHRAFDMARTPERALADVIQTGADRVLTSGAAPTAVLGREQLKHLVELAAGRVGLLVGGGVRPGNIADLARFTGAREFHSALRRHSASPMRYRHGELHLGATGADEYSRTFVHESDVRDLVRALEAVPTL